MRHYDSAWVVDLAVCVDDDADAESLVYQLGAAGYAPIASVEHETCHRLATVRLQAPQKVKVDLLFASSGIEDEVVAAATPDFTEDRPYKRS